MVLYTVNKIIIQKDGSSHSVTVNLNFATVNTPIHIHQENYDTKCLSHNTRKWTLKWLNGW